MKDELIYSVGIDWDKLGFDSLKQSLSKTINAFAVATAAASAASAAIFAMGKSYAESTDKLVGLSKQANTTVQDIQKLTFAADDNQSSYESVAAALQSLSKQQYELLRGKGDFEAWGRIGVDATQFENTADLLMAVSDGMQSLPQHEKLNIMDRLGINRDLIGFMNLGSKGLRDLGSEAERLGQIDTAKMIQSSQDFMAGWLRASTVIGGIVKKVSSNLLDSTINPAIESFNKFMSKNMQKISETLTKIFEGIAKASQFVFSIIQRVAIDIQRFTNMVGGAENALKLLAVALIAVKANTIRAMAPAILVVGGLYLAFNELVSFLNDQESFIGDFLGVFGIASSDIKGILKDLPLMEIAIGAVAVSVIGLKNAIMLLKIPMIAISAMTGPIGLVVTAITGAAAAIYIFRDDIKKAMDDIWSFIKETAENISGLFSGIFGGILDKIGSVIGKAKGLFDFSGVKLPQIKNPFDFSDMKLPDISDVFKMPDIGQIAGNINHTLQPIANPIASTASTVNNNVRNAFTINIDGSKDPAAVADSVREQMERYFDQQAARGGF